MLKYNIIPKLKIMFNIITFIYYYTVGYLIIYSCCIALYAINYFNTIRKEFYWNSMPENKVINELRRVISKFDSSTIFANTEELMERTADLNEYHIDFKVACYKAGIKPSITILLEKHLKNKNHQ